MVQDELYTVKLSDDFYRDSFTRVAVIIVFVCASGTLLIALSLYLYLSKPKPVVFPVNNDWRVQAEIGLTKSYRTQPELMQWVSDTIRKVFDYDFTHYMQQQKRMREYFTPTGWQSYLNQLNNYANYNNVQQDKLFVSAVPSGAPFVLQQGILSGRYAWWIQIPITLTSANSKEVIAKNLILQVLVVRVPTDASLTGVAIDNVIVQVTASNQLLGTG
jgi:intracellular multiplication protein IcmL